MNTPFHQVLETLKDSKVYRNRKVVKSGASGDAYTIAVRKSDARWTCSCKHWIFRCQKAGTDCQHIQEIRERYGDRSRIESVLDKVDRLIATMAPKSADEVAMAWIAIKDEADMLLLFFENENRVNEASSLGSKISNVKTKVMGTA